jgi:hypothetical protein
MYAILGEDQSDFDTLTVIVRRLLNNESVPVKGKGFGGCGKLLRECAKSMSLLRRTGCQRFILCHDSDNNEPEDVRKRILQSVEDDMRDSSFCCIVIPVRAIEAWILADVQALTKVFKGWRPKCIGNPEAVSDPCAELERLSRQENGRPRYVHATHNAAVAKHLDLELVATRCPSFRPLAKFVKQTLTIG